VVILVKKIFKIGEITVEGENGNIEYICPFCKYKFMDEVEIFIEGLLTTCPSCGSTIRPEPPEDIKELIDKIRQQKTKEIEEELMKVLEEMKWKMV
jgi:DNA-directed RNA polymerase subunit RPC12/RpoP